LDYLNILKITNRIINEKAQTAPNNKHDKINTLINFTVEYILNQIVL